ncbi:YbaB/EbfC family nucleoid-associated protein [Rhodococcus sp. IEGM 1341]|uniref:YbaB/EbfC family nucleoid-associated protein n=1 Tax=Rhodococcus sp. IEGM 1341 TaxID=3047090 RepID=UPI0024B747CD|nr:YbaB/EbfC family nucleoid-associated protein [Rhodococcus sp. IEGM 1341]MDI9927447.1 YbaB/EbfC family nucleoid-associated protein [Rhodococcus sp. IEGM 1341]
MTERIRRVHRFNEEANAVISSHEELGAKVRRLQQAVADIHGITQLDGVTVRTDANGRLTGLQVSRDAYVRGPDVLADLIMRAYNRTADDVQRRTAAMLAELRDDASVARIVDATGSRANPEVAVEPAQFGDFSVAQHRFSGQPYAQPSSRGPDEPEKSGDSYFQRKSWLE